MGSSCIFLIDSLIVFVIIEKSTPVPWGTYNADKICITVLFTEPFFVVIIAGMSADTAIFAPSTSVFIPEYDNIGINVAITGDLCLDIFCKNVSAKRSWLNSVILSAFVGV